MSRPSLEEQSIRFDALNSSPEAWRLRSEAVDLVQRARNAGLIVEIKSISVGAPRMGGTYEIVSVTPSREGYQSTT